MTGSVRGLVTTLGFIALASLYAGLRWGVVGLVVALALGAVVVFYLGFHKPRQNVKPDPSAEPENVGSVPNVPIAEMVVDELRQQGIEAFYKVRGVGFYARSSDTTPSVPCDIYVARRDAEAARAFLPDAHAKAARTVLAPVLAQDKKQAD